MSKKRIFGVGAFCAAVGALCAYWSVGRAIDRGVTCMFGG
jgi:hypothetical protein